MTKEELKTILENHKHWIEEDCEGWEGMKADLSNADLSYADLSYADLSNADLSYADLSNADLSNADLSNADLSNADLRNANLRYADLRNADLLEARNLYVPYSCPDFGIFIGWKKARWKDDEVIVMLEIPDDAKRLSATGRKCRCDKAKVIAIESIVGLTAYREAHSTYDTSFTYKVGETVSVDNFDENRWVECSTGIHFFINRQEAVNY